MISPHNSSELLFGLLLGNEQQAFFALAKQIAPSLGMASMCKNEKSHSESTQWLASSESPAQINA